MTSKVLGNPAGMWGATADTQAQEVIECVNNSGGTLLPGDLVVMTDLNGVLVATTTTASDPAVIGVVLPVDRGLRTVGAGETYASGAQIPVCVRGPARVNIAANTVAAGAPLASSTAAKVAAVPATAASVAALQALVGSFIGNAMEAQSAKDANNTIRAYIQKM
jgi:hypothetical protein